MATSPLGEEEVLQMLRAIIVDALRVDAVSVAPQTDLLEDLGAESIDIVDIRFRVEDTFGFKMGQQELKNALAEQATANDAREGLTVERMVKYILRRVGEQERA